MTHHHTSARMAAALVLAGSVLLAACGTSSPAAAPAVSAAPAASTTDTAGVAPSDTSAAAPAATGGDACGLVTEKDVTAALGTDPGPGSPTTSHGASACQYGTYQTSFVLVSLLPTRGRAAYDETHDKAKLTSKKTGETVADVPGLGDRAFEGTGPGTASIAVNKGNTYLGVLVEILAAASPPHAQALALARSGTAKL